jgi:hypothetical protein
MKTAKESKFIAKWERYFRQHEEMSSTRAPGVSPRRQVPAQLCLYPMLRALSDEFPLRGTWFEGHIQWFFSLLPRGHFNPTRYRRAAIWVTDEILQRRLKQTPLTPLAFDQRGHCKDEVGSAFVSLRIGLRCSDGEIIRHFRDYLNKLRKIESVPVCHHRPGDIQVLQRDYVVFVLSEEHWPIADIEQQLAHMNCRSFPLKCDSKAFVRRVQRRFRTYRHKIESLTEQIEQESHSVLDNFLRP